MLEEILVGQGTCFVSPDTRVLGTRPGFHIAPKHHLDVALKVTSTAGAEHSTLLALVN